ncbi:hypothetical protein [Nitratiruptor sp. YY09-18]|uniref:hypothetical protein n=1 Tax=Nitratiruptor sp. YY09-18 TaxID=2724901 RepID=UPI001916B90E|nr:hypothetical protein [Nitratiruptor sp. YY09-18]BCD68443.1 hypothetical protein NitYY0918_C1358 [Nitratiruptor sp. YY09-18]
MRYILGMLIATLMLFADCTHAKKVIKVDFKHVTKGELPVGWIVSCSGKSFPGIWEVNGKKQLFVKYPRGSKFEQKNLFFTNQYYFTNGSCQTILSSKENAGVIFRARDRKNYYAVSIDFKNRKLIVEEIKNKEPKILLSKKLPNNIHPHSLKVAFCNDKATIFLDNREVAKLFHLKVRPGGVGVISSGKSQAYYDDIVIEVVQ